MIFYVHELLLFTKRKTYIFEKYFQEANSRSLEKKVKMQDHSFVAQGPYDIVYGLDPNSSSNVKYVYNGPCNV